MPKSMPHSRKVSCCAKLESRLLLSLTINGTPGNDVIGLDYNGTSYVWTTDNYATLHYTLKTDSSPVTINAGDGNDTINIERNGQNAVTVDGGLGDDILQISPKAQNLSNTNFGDIYFSGGAGHDQVFAYDNNSTVLRQYKIEDDTIQCDETHIHFDEDSHVELVQLVGGQYNGSDSNYLFDQYTVFSTYHCDTIVQSVGPAYDDIHASSDNIDIEQPDPDILIENDASSGFIDRSLISGTNYTVFHSSNGGAIFLNEQKVSGFDVVTDGGNNSIDVNTRLGLSVGIFNDGGNDVYSINSDAVIPSGYHNFAVEAYGGVFSGFYQGIFATAGTPGTDIVKIDDSKTLRSASYRIDANAVNAFSSNEDLTVAFNESYGGTTTLVELTRATTAYFLNPPYQVTGTSAALHLITPAGASPTTIVVGVHGIGGLSSYLNSVQIDNNSVSDSLVFDDTNDSVARAVEFYTSGNYEYISGLAPGLLSWPAVNDLATIQVATGAGADSVRVSQNTTSIALFNSGGIDAITLGATTGLLAGLSNLFSIQEAVGTATILIDDSGDTVGAP